MRYTERFSVSQDTPNTLYIQISCFEFGYLYITAPGFGLYRQAHRISPRLTEILIRPTINFINTTKSQTGILLETTVESAIFVFDKTTRYYGEDSMMLLPDDILGQSYVIPSFWNNMGFPRFNIIGTQNNTQVNATFMSNVVNNFYDRDDPNQIYRNMKQAYSLNYLEVLNFDITGDPSGTVIESDKPVAVLYEDPVVTVKPNYTSSRPSSKTSTQPLPVYLWDTEYIVPPVYPRAKYLVRVFAYYNETSITMASSTHHWTALINRGELKEYILGTEPSLVRGNKPISVYQYSFSSDYLPGGHSSMTLVPPLNRYSRGPYTVPTKGSGGYYSTSTDYASILIEKQFKDQIMYNGSSLQPVATYRVTDLSNYVVIIAQLNSSATVHILTNSDPSATFGLMVYGISQGQQYGFAGGMSFRETGK